MFVDLLCHLRHSHSIDCVCFAVCGGNRCWLDLRFLRRKVDDFAGAFGVVLALCLTFNVFGMLILSPIDVCPVNDFELNHDGGWWRNCDDRTTHDFVVPAQYVSDGWWDGRDHGPITFSCVGFLVSWRYALGFWSDGGLGFGRFCL